MATATSRRKWIRWAGKTVYDYDELDRLIGITDPVLELTAFGYDALDNLVAVTDPKGLTTSYTYNGLGDHLQLSSEDTGLSTFARDAAGNLDLVTDARGKTADYGYDALGRLLEIAYADQVVQYVYDQGANGAGRLTGASNGATSLAWTYDAHGRVVSRAQTVDTVGLAVGYAYDSSGRLSALTTPSGQAIAYSYGNGRVTEITVNGTALLSQVTYEPFGPTRGWQWGNGSTTVRAYDTDGRLTSLTSAGSTTYAYFPDGLIKSRTDAVAVSPPLAEGSTLFTIAAASNRVQSASGLEARSYGYDAAGNTLSDGTRTFAYNDAGRLVSATSNGATTAYTYNGLGERVKKAGGGLTRYFAYDESGHLIGEYDVAGDLIQETVWFGDIPVAMLRPNTSGAVDIYYVHTDHLNTPGRITRPADDVVVWRWESGEPRRQMKIRMGILKSSNSTCVSQASIGIRQCAWHAFRKNFNDMIFANTIGADRYFRCKANCEAAKCGNYGIDQACTISDTRESTDIYLK